MYLHANYLWFEWSVWPLKAIFSELGTWGKYNAYPKEKLALSVTCLWKKNEVFGKWHNNGVNR